MADYSAMHTMINSNYKSAISRYNSQKQAFLMSLKTQTIKDEKDFINQLNNAIAGETNSEIEGDFENAFSAIHKEVEEAFMKALNGDTPDINLLLSRFKSKLSTGKEKAQDISEANLSNYYKRMIQDIENFLTTNKVTKDHITKILNSQGMGGSNSTQGVILNQFYGYARRVMFSLLTGGMADVSTKNYKQSLKGYYKEDLLVDGLNKVLRNSGLSAVGTGAIDDDGAQIEIDIFVSKTVASNDPQEVLSTIEKRLDGLTGANATATVTMGEPTWIGAQSKSWIEPWIENKMGGNQKFLSLGSRMNLLNSIAPDGLRDWHEGALLASQHLAQIIGVNNVLFSTGANVYWTADLIANFRAMNYYLAFYISKTNHEATGEVVWERDPDC